MHDQPDYLPPKRTVAEMIEAARRDIAAAPGPAEWMARAEAERRERRQSRNDEHNP